VARKMCKLVKDGFHSKKTKQFAKLVKEPKFVCKTCGRVANRKACLCKPVELS
jgi:hypothetical protein